MRRPRSKIHGYCYSSEGLLEGGTPSVTISGQPGTGGQAGDQQQAGGGDASLQQHLDRVLAELEAQKGHGREWEKRAKENAAAAKRLKDMEDATKSAEERLGAQVAQLQTQIEAASGEIARLTAAIEHGLSKTDLVLLPKGLSAEDTAAAAKLLAERIGSAQQQETPPSLDGGARGGTAPTSWNQMLHDELVRKTGRASRR